MSETATQIAKKRSEQIIELLDRRIAAEAHHNPGILRALNAFELMKRRGFEYSELVRVLGHRPTLAQITTALRKVQSRALAEKEQQPRRRIRFE